MFKITIRDFPKLARVVANVASDGHLQLDKRRGVVSFYSKNLKIIKEEDKRFFRLFKIHGHVYENKGYFNKLTYGIFFTSKRLATYLAKIGTPVGNKTMKIFYVPNWIINGNKEVKREYLRGICNNEGSIYPTRGLKKKRWRILIEQQKYIKLKEFGKKYMFQIKQMLEDLGIKCSPIRLGKKVKRKDGTYSICIRFEIEEKYFKKFYEKIDFEDKIKNKKLLNVIAGNVRGY